MRTSLSIDQANSGSVRQVAQTSAQLAFSDEACLHSLQFHLHPTYHQFLFQMAQSQSPKDVVKAISKIRKNMVFTTIVSQ
jgi:hypothetical protein